MKRDTHKPDDFDRLLKEAALQAAETMGQQYLEEAEKDAYYPSFEFNQRVRKMIEAETKPSAPVPLFQKLYLSFSKAALWILLVLIVLLFAIPKVASARNWVTKLVMESNPKYVTYYLQETDTVIDSLDNSEKIFPVGAYYPTYIPEGFRLRLLNYNGSSITYRFVDSKGKLVNVQVIGTGETMNLDNENLEEDSIEIVNGYEARYTLKLERHCLIWTTENYIIFVNTNLSKEETLKIANGILKTR